MSQLAIFSLTRHPSVPVSETSRAGACKRTTSTAAAFSENYLVHLTSCLHCHVYTMLANVDNFNIDGFLEPELSEPMHAGGTLHASLLKPNAANLEHEP